MRPFKGAHPARALIPAETTLVVPVASADVFGKRLNTITSTARRSSAR